MIKHLVMLLTTMALPLTAVAGEGATLAIKLPDGAIVTSAAATASKLKLDTAGRIQDGEVVFENLLPDTAYEIRLVLADGQVLQGVDMAWYSIEPPSPDAPALADDDREEIRHIVSDVPSFYDRSEILLLQGDRDRAVALVELLRDRAFHDSRSGEVIWRVELWYFRFRHGGWEKVGQQNRVLRRERFAAGQYERTTASLKWLGQLGGIVLEAEQSREIVLDLEPEAEDG